jgi:uncharacterized protein with ParB-like and HNH nuclease domain
MAPVVGLPVEADKGNVVKIFERSNRTGVKLSLFDLAVGRFYLEGFKLRNLWEEFHDWRRELSDVLKLGFS